MKNQKGFTLIELVMVILLLGILAAVAIPRFWDLSTSANQSAGDGGIAGVKSGITILNASLRLTTNASYPTNYPGNPLEGNVVTDLYSKTTVNGGATTCTNHGGDGRWSVNSLTNATEIYYKWKGANTYSSWSYSSVTGIVSGTGTGTGGRVDASCT